MIEALIGCANPGALVNSTSTPAERRIKTVVINSAGPSDMASSVVLLRPLPLQQALSLAVILLLLPKCTDRIAPVMPDYGGWIETQRPASFLQTPTDRKSTRLNSSHGSISYAVFCLKKKNTK